MVLLQHSCLQPLQQLSPPTFVKGWLLLLGWWDGQIIGGSGDIGVVMVVVAMVGYFGIVVVVVTVFCKASICDCLGGL